MSEHPYKKSNRLDNVALYCRLSNEDHSSGNESNSIGNQKNLLQQYAMDRAWNIVNTYCDDGFTGLNFIRPGFQAMLADIENKKISTVLVKDLSRLGRDYIQVGYYLDRFFPENGIRFIAINDAIDIQKNTESDIAPFKSVMNDMYSKDISKKVRSIFDIKRLQGKFIGAFAPYGYQKDKGNNNLLIIDKETYPIVQRIFNLYIGGKGCTYIATQLNEEGIRCPSAQNLYRYGTSNGRSKINLWSSNTVRSILQNMTYTGCLAQNKYRRINYKSKKLETLNKEDWIVVDNTHEAIISKDDFSRTSELFGFRNQRTLNPRNVNIFSGFVFCADCSTYMTYSKSRQKINLICSGYKRFGKKYCTRHTIEVNQLTEVILLSFKGLVQKYLQAQDFNQKSCKEITVKKDKDLSLSKKLISMKKRIIGISTLTRNLYEDKINAILSEAQFIEMNTAFNEEKTKLIQQTKEVQNMMEKNQMNSIQPHQTKNLYEEFLGIDILSREMLSLLVNKIEINSERRIQIHYNFLAPH